MKSPLFTLTLQLLLAIITTLHFSSCTDLRCVDGNNEMSRQTRTLDSDFEGVILSTDFTVIITHSLKDSLSIEAESNLMSDIIADVKNNRLELRTPEYACLNPRKPVIVRIYTDKLNTLDISGSGSIQSDSILTDYLRINISGSGSVKAPILVRNLYTSITGSGSIEVWGKASTSDLTISGSGIIESYGLEQDSCSVSISGTGNNFIYVRKMLDATISGSGSVYYKGNPEVYTHISGSGKVVNQQSGGKQAYFYKGSFSTIPSRSMYMIF